MCTLTSRPHRPSANHREPGVRSFYLPCSGRRAATCPLPGCHCTWYPDGTKRMCRSRSVRIGATFRLPVAHRGAGAAPTTPGCLFLPYCSAVDGRVAAQRILTPRSRPREGRTGESFQTTRGEGRIPIVPSPPSLVSSVSRSRPSRHRRGGRSGKAVLPRSDELAR